MSSTIAKLEDLINRHSSLKCGAVIHATGDVTDRVGDFTHPPYQELESAVFGPYGDSTATFEMAAQYENDRKMLPQGMGQGDLFALVDKPQTEFVLVVFGEKSTDFHEHQKHRKEISASILEIFTPTEI